MANWVRTLDISDEWRMANDFEITTKQLAMAIANKLKIFNIAGDLDDLGDIIEEFESMDDDVGFEEFNYTMAYLYDWADINLDNEWNGRKNCWVKTF